MRREELQKQIAQVAYNTAYGRDKHYATYDIVSKIPNWGSLVFLAIGIAAIGYPSFGGKLVGVVISILSVALIYITFYSDKLDSYCETAQVLERIFTDLTTLYFQLDADTYTPNIQHYLDRKLLLEQEMRKQVISRQVAGSDSYAHIKMFWTKRTQTQWVVEALKLKFIDKIPFSTFLLMLMAFFFGVGLASGLICVKLGLLHNYL